MITIACPENEFFFCYSTHLWFSHFISCDLFWSEVWDFASYISIPCVNGVWQWLLVVVVCGLWVFSEQAGIKQCHLCPGCRSQEAHVQSHMLRHAEPERDPPQSSKPCRRPVRLRTLSWFCIMFMHPPTLPFISHTHLRFVTSALSFRHYFFLLFQSCWLSCPCCSVLDLCSKAFTHKSHKNAIVPRLITCQWCTN